MVKEVYLKQEKKQMKMMRKILKLNYQKKK